MRLIVATAFAVLILAGCSRAAAPAAESATAAPSPVAQQTEVATNSPKNRGEAAIYVRLAQLSGLECTDAMDAVLLYPSTEELAQTDAQLAAGTLKGNVDSRERPVGTEKDVLARMGATEVLDRTDDGMVWFITAKPEGVGMVATATPGGHLVWSVPFRARPQTCP